MTRVRALLYDPKFDYQPGNLVFMRHPTYGESLARVKRRIEAPGLAKIEFDFLDAAFDARWKADRSTPYFAANLGGKGLVPSHIYISTAKEYVIHKARQQAAPVDGDAHDQSVYQRLILDLIRPGAAITIADLKATVQEELTLTAGDWATRKNSPSKVVWLEKMHAALHNLVRTGIFTKSGRGAYRRSM